MPFPRGRQRRIGRRVADVEVDYVLYHEGCTDGFAAAWVAHCHATSRGRAGSVRFQSLRAGGTELGNREHWVGKRVAVFDVLPAREALAELVSGASFLVLRDHHATNADAMKALVDNPRVDAVFDESMSGAGLAWTYFFPDVPLPALVLYVQDRDLWTLRLPGVHEVSAYMTHVLGYRFEAWDVAATLSIPELIELGRVARAVVVSLVKLVSSKPDMLSLPSPPGAIALLVNAAGLQSDIAETLLQECPAAVFVAVWRHQSGLFRVALRGSNASPVHLGKLATFFGGGGHRNSAGFGARFDGPESLKSSLVSAYSSSLEPNNPVV